MTPLVLGLCGSLREPSYTRMAIQRVLDATAQGGVRRSWLTENRCACPGATAGRRRTTLRRAQFRQRVAEADALVIGSPQYCDTYSAVIKNAIELLGAAHLPRRSWESLRWRRGHRRWAPSSRCNPSASA